MKRKAKRPAKNVAKMRNGATIRFVERPGLTEYESALKRIAPELRRIWLDGSWETRTN